jgi:hypothetical protein
MCREPKELPYNYYNHKLDYLTSHISSLTSLFSPYNKVKVKKK